VKIHMPRLVSVSSSRADISILRPVWEAIIAAGNMDLHVFLTGMHQAAGAPDAGVPDGVEVHRGGADMGGHAETAAQAMGAIISATGEVLADLRPDAMFIVGDRLDMAPVALAALPFNLPIAHLHGGEVTKGAVDNDIRYMLSQVANLHLVSNEFARERLLNKGIDPSQIIITGAPGLDTLVGAPRIAANEFANEVGMPPDRPFALLTIHPETANADLLAPLNACLEGIRSWDGAVLVTAPNSDPAAAELRRVLEGEAAAQPSWTFVDTLGGRLYPNALRHAAFMLGNSSSGIIEAGLFGLPVIDVGRRQEGRESGPHVTHVENDGRAVADAIAGLCDGRAAPRRYDAGTLYGDGGSGPRIATALQSWLETLSVR
jgi:UDP-hydrolysing UDP-N-acetyl-D-glucosamine 2-epimerase